MTDAVRSIPNICDVSIIAGPEADPNAAPDVFCELPHGATRLQDLKAAKSLTRQYPGDRHDLFFLANTDQGSPEYCERLAQLITSPELAEAIHPGSGPAAARRKVLIVRALLPRTILDVNRNWGNAEELKASKMTLGVPDFITHPEDLAKLRKIYDTYRANVEAAYGLVCESGGYAFNLHTYAPISLSLVEGEYIVDTLEHAYQPQNIGNYPRRPLVEMITACPGEPSLADTRLTQLVHQRYADIGIESHENDPFYLIPATAGWSYATKWPQRILTIELSREELAEPFNPFVEMHIDPAKVERMTRPLAAAYLEFMAD